MSRLGLNPQLSAVLRRPYDKEPECWTVPPAQLMKDCRVQLPLLLQALHVQHSVQAHELQGLLLQVIPDWLLGTAVTCQLI